MEVAGSPGVLIRAAKLGKISKGEALETLDKLSNVMWLGIDVYDGARKVIAIS